MPFTHAGGDPQEDYFSDGISEDLITALSKFPDLFIIARESAFKYRGTHADERQIGRQQGVRYLLERSVRRDGEQLRITARLVDMVTGSHLWAESCDRKLSALFTEQDEVTQRIAFTLVSHVSASELNRATRKPAESMLAYDYSLRGKAESAGIAARTRVEQRKRVAEGRRHLRQSLAAEPRYVAAATAPARTYMFTWREHLDDDYQQQSTLDHALTLARHAVDLDPFLAEAHAELGVPGLPQVHVWYAAAAGQTGRDEEATAAAANVVVHLQPDFTVAGFLAFIRLAKQEDADHLADGLRRAGLL